MIAQAQSGTGKTATFSIALLQQIDLSLRECQALVLAPTRELAQQIQKVGLVQIVLYTGFPPSGTVRENFIFLESQGI